MKHSFRTWLWKNQGVAVWRSALPYGAQVYFDLHRLGFIPKVAFDVGANVGQTSTLIADLWPSSNIHAFEPVDKTFNILKKNIARCAKVKPWKIACSDRVGDAEIYLDKTYSEISSLENSTLKGGRVCIKLSTIDLFCEENCVYPDLIKIDTEGHEMSVLSGAKMLLSRRPPAFCVIEGGFNNARPFVNAQELIKWFEGYEYRFSGLYDHGLNVEYGYLERADLLFVHHSWRRSKLA